MSKEILQQKLMTTLEVLMPPLVHMLNLSLVEIVIHGRILYDVMSDTASIIFMMSLAMIFQAFRKKIAPEVKSFPTKMALVVSEFFC